MQVNAFPSAIRSLPSAAPADGGAGKLVDGFGQALARAVETLNEVQQNADQQGLALATGQPVELHDVVIAQEEAALSLQLAVQVRNKLVEAYQDIMRMQI